MLGFVEDFWCFVYSSQHIRSTLDSREAVSVPVVATVVVASQRCSPVLDIDGLHHLGV